MNMDRCVTIQELDLNQADDDDNNSNVFEENFEHDKKYQEKFDRQEKINEEGLNTDEA